MDVQDRKSTGRLCSVALPVTIMLVSSFGFAQKLPCTDTENMRAEEESDGLRSWDAIFSWYKSYARCNNVSAAEGVSESIARTLLDHWTTLPRLAKLGTLRSGFRRFSLAGVNATLNRDDVQRIKEKARMDCPNGMGRLCGDLARAADAAMADQTHAHAERSK
jgi:hypothetical protein